MARLQCRPDLGSILVRSRVIIARRAAWFAGTGVELRHAPGAPEVEDTHICYFAGGRRPGEGGGGVPAALGVEVGDPTTVDGGGVPGYAGSSPRRAAGQPPFVAADRPRRPRQRSPVEEQLGTQVVEDPQRRHLTYPSAGRPGSRWP